MNLSTLHTHNCFIYVRHTLTTQFTLMSAFCLTADSIDHELKYVAHSQLFHLTRHILTTQFTLMSAFCLTADSIDHELKYVAHSQLFHLCTSHTHNSVYTDECVLSDR